ncbi:MAG TPA: cysteine desulfurase [Steroidobacteraceae bacterium]|nr:cysteine desulfurase [Steroidobacteraceae bacterium]
MNATPERLAGDAADYDVERIRRDFPILSRQVHGKPLVFLDSAASSQRPASVLQAVDEYERLHHANVHRGVHLLSQEATDLFEKARERVRAFVNARSTREVIFTRGTTEGINLVAQSYARSRLVRGDEILLTALEHHANIVPWQLVAEQTGAVVRAVPMDRRGVVSLDAVAGSLNERTRIVACAHVSNALGTVLPVREITRLAHARGAVVLIDGAQAVPHQRVDLQALDCDFYAFSAHKMYGPTGIGALIGRESLLDAMPPWQGGGDMILTVSFEKTTFNTLPFKFEAGTPNISGAVGMAAAVDYIESLGIERIHAHEQRLLASATAKLQRVPGLEIIGTAPDKASVISFTVDGIHPHDLGTILDAEGVAVRTGHHCAMPVMEYFDVPATARASFACYSREADVDALVGALHKAREVFS